MKKQSNNERDSGFNIDDILQEPKHHIPVKRSNSVIATEAMKTDGDFGVKRSKVYDSVNSRDFMISYNDKHYPSCLGIESEITNHIFGVPKFSEPVQNESNPNAGFGIAQLLSSKDSFLAKSIVVHDKKSNISQIGMNFPKKSANPKEENAGNNETVLESSTVGATSSHDNDEIDHKSNLFLTPQLDCPLQSTDQSQMTGEENEKILVDTDCRLFLFDKEANAWKNIGAINLHVNEYVRKEDDPIDKFYTRIIARSQSLQRPVLNFKLWPNIIIDLPSENTILLQASYMNDTDNIRFISLSMKPPQAHVVWNVIKEKSLALNNFISKKEMIKEYRATHENHQDMNDDEVYELITKKPNRAPAKKMRLLDSKKTFQPPDFSSSEEPEESSTSSLEATEEEHSHTDNNSTDEDDDNTQTIMLNGHFVEVDNQTDAIEDENDSSNSQTDQSSDNQELSDESPTDSQLSSDKIATPE